MNATTNPTPQRYQWQIRGAEFDFYRLCEILGIRHHAQTHALKKVIRAGRSLKSRDQDIREAVDCLKRWLEMVQEDGLRYESESTASWIYQGREITVGDVFEALGMKSIKQCDFFVRIVFAGKLENPLTEDIEAAIAFGNDWLAVLDPEAKPE